VRIATDRPQAPTAIRTNLGAIFLSMELSCTTWLLTSLSPGGGERMSKHAMRSGDVAGLRARFPVQGQSTAPDRAGRSDHRYAGGGSGRLLDPPPAAG
jgi:transposase